MVAESLDPKLFMYPGYDKSAGLCNAQMSTDPPAQLQSERILPLLWHAAVHNRVMRQVCIHYLLSPGRPGSFARRCSLHALHVSGCVDLLAVLAQPPRHRMLPRSRARLFDSAQRTKSCPGYMIRWKT